MLTSGLSLSYITRPIKIIFNDCMVFILFYLTNLLLDRYFHHLWFVCDKGGDLCLYIGVSLFIFWISFSILKSRVWESWVRGCGKAGGHEQQRVCGHCDSPASGCGRDGTSVLYSRISVQTSPLWCPDRTPQPPLEFLQALRVFSLLFFSVKYMQVVIIRCCIA